MKICQLDNDDKPREKALKLGIESLSNAELLAIVIGSGLPGQSVIELSQAILLASGNKLSGLSRQSAGEMTRKYKGIGPAKAISIAAAFELGRRCMAEIPQEASQIRSSADIDRYIRANTRLELIEHEEFWMISLTRANRVKGAVRISHGGTTATVVDVKLIIKQALDQLSEGIILAHNHPSGNLIASPQDRELTRRIKQACEIFSIRLLDHLIIGGKRYFSFADEGML